MKASVEQIHDLVSASYEDFDHMYEAILRFASLPAPNRAQLRSYLKEQTSVAPEEALKLATAAQIVGEYEEAVEFLRISPEGREKRWLLGLAFKSQESYAHAIADFERAAARDFDAVRVFSEIVECHRLSGDLKSADQVLKQLEKVAGGSAAFYYQSAGLAEAEGELELAIAQLEKATQKDDRFVPALFRLAYLVDLRGDEELAIELYNKCLTCDPVHVNALINLAVLYEDEGEYDRAASLLRRVVKVYPNHERARLFLKDVESSKDMFYDEEFEKRKDKFQQVLDMPISDFELSVRSRNCLKKMGIRTLGDLTRISEAELLSYKNFGETSLNEIKVILNSKSLHLGQALEDQASKRAAAILPGAGGETDEPSADQAALAKSIDELDLSVRSKKCLQKLNVQTIGDLTNYTEAQLMAIKNFGNISLKEVKEKLEERGLSLRHPEI